MVFRLYSLSFLRVLTNQNERFQNGRRVTQLKEAKAGEVSGSLCFEKKGTVIALNQSAFSISLSFVRGSVTFNGYNPPCFTRADSRSRGRLHNR